MVRKEIQFTLKDGRLALIRSPKNEDIQGMLDYLYISSGETEFILRYPEECQKYTVEGEQSLFDRVNSAENEAMLVCIVDGKVAGNCQITWSKGIKTRHCIFRRHPDSDFGDIRTAFRKHPDSITAHPDTLSGR